MHSQKAIQQKDKEIARLNGIYESLMSKAGVEVFHERARVAGAHELVLQSRTVTAKHILIATGGWPFVPHFPGSQHVITSNEAFSLPQLPRSILIVGGGYIAVEFAGIFAALGVKTAHLLRGFDHDLVENFTHHLRQSVDVHLHSQVLSVTPEASQYRVHFADGDSCLVDKVMFATGRLPNTAKLGLEVAGVALGKILELIVD